MYRALRDFQQQPSVSSVPLGQFLENRQDVAFFEKVYFIQQYFLKGAVIPTFSDQNYLNSGRLRSVTASTYGIFCSMLFLERI